MKINIKGKIYSKDYNEYIPEYRAADKLKSAMKAKIYPEKLIVLHSEIDDNTELDNNMS